MKQIHSKNGFTIVELLIVIVVIGILAAIVIVAFNGVQKKATNSVMQASIKSAGTKMKATMSDTDTYPTSLPSDLTAPAGMGLALTTVASSSEFCINIVSEKYSDLQWHMDQTLKLESGLCSGAVISASIIGTYPSTPAPVSSAGTATGDGGGFVVKTNEEWTNIGLTWTAVPSVTRYEIQYRMSPTDTWYLARAADGYGGFYTSDSSNPTYSAQIPASTTSLTWTGVMPTAANQTYQYRLRSFVGSTASAWYTASLVVPVTADLPSMTSITATPNAAWNAVTVSWTGSITKIPSYHYEVQFRTSPSGTWYLLNSADGAGGGWNITSSGQANMSYSAQIPANVSSRTWTGVMPVNSTDTYEYRVRGSSSTLTGVVGGWATTSLSPPANSTLPIVPTFTATPAGDWSSLTLNWSGDVSAIPSYHYEIQYRPGTSGEWYLARYADGYGGFTVNSSSQASSTYSAQIPANVSSRTWTGVNPTAAGQTYQYRIRGVSGTLSGTYGDWKTISLTR